MRSFFEVLEAIPQRRDTVLGGKIHESSQRRLAKLGGPSQGNLILAIKFECQQSSGFLGEAALLQIGDPQKFRWQLYIHSFHSSKLAHRRQFVMPYRLLAPNSAASRSRSDGPVEVRHVSFAGSPSTGSRISFEIRASRPVQLRIGKAAPREYLPGLTTVDESI